MASRGLNVFVNIGAVVSPTLNSAASQAERRFMAMGRTLKAASAESKLAMAEAAGAYKGFVGLAAAGGIVGAIRGSISEGSKLDHELQALRSAGSTATEVAQAMAAAQKTIGDTPTAGLTDTIRLLNETRLAYGGLGHAIENVGFNSKMGAMLKSIMGDRGGDEATMFNNLVRGLELRSGKMGAADYQRQASKLFQAFEVSGGTVSPENFLGFAQQAGLALRGYNEDYLTRVVPSLIQEMGGDRAGTASTALYNQFMGRTGVGGKSITAEWMRLGLVPARGTGGNLSATGWTPGTLKGNALAMANSLSWIETVLFPTLRAHGIDTNNKSAMALQATRMFGRETGKRLASTLFDPAQLARIHADQALYAKALGPDAAYGQAMANDPKMAMAASAASLKNLEASIGRVFTPALAAALQTTARGINSIATAIGSHPNLTRGVLTIAGAFATWKIASVGLGWAMHGAGAGLAGFTAGLGRLALAPVVGMAGAMRGLGTAIGSAQMMLAVGGWKGLGGAMLGAIMPTNLLKFAMTGLKLTMASLGIGLVVMALTWLVNNAGNVGKFFGAMGSALAKTAPITKPFVSAIGAVVGWLEKLIGPTGPEAWIKWGTAAGNAIGAVVNTIAGFVGWIGKAIDATGKFFHLSGNPPPGAGAPGAKPRTGAHRAKGGTVSAGSTYEIDEKGTEWFAPGQSGTIIPADTVAALTAAMSGGGGSAARGGDVHNNMVVNVYDATDPNKVARFVRSEFKRMAADARGALHD